MTSIERVEGMSLVDFERRFEEVGPFEIIDGEIIEAGINKGIHAYILTLLYTALTQYFLTHPLGVIFADTPFVLSENVDWVKGSRLPDVMFYRQDRFDAYRANDPEWGDKPYNLLPDLVVEILSPSDRPGKVARKIAAYVEDGVPMIWVIDPKKKMVIVYTGAAFPYAMLTEKETLDGGDVVPGFSMPVAALFA